MVNLGNKFYVVIVDGRPCTVEYNLLTRLVTELLGDIAHSSSFSSLYTDCKVQSLESFLNILNDENFFTVYYKTENNAKFF